MMDHGIRSYLCLLFTFLIVITSVFAQEEEKPATRDKGPLGGFLKIIGDAAQESLKQGIDEFIGTYKGRIGEVKLLERRGDSIALEVKYEGVRRKDGVYVQGEVMGWGNPMAGFKSTLTPIQEKDGVVRLTIGWQQQDDSGWSVSTEEAITSDQIRLSLVRDTNPERPFGILDYDFQKTWTANHDIETVEDTAGVETSPSGGSIELAEGETPAQAGAPAPGTLKPAGVLIKPGAVLAPRATTTIQQSTALPGTTVNTQTLQIPARVISDYNFFTNASKAKWRSAAGDLSFPGKTSNNQGFALTLNTGVICPNNNAVNLLQTHPQWVNGGWIEGRFPAMVLGQNVKFKSVGALLKGADQSDGVVMSVSVWHDGKLYPVLSKRVNTTQYVDMEADLSSWNGKTIQIVMAVKSGPTSTRDWAVWVNPRLVKP
ncbi:MAG: hypothetical protein FP816_13075 [Desulfobacteraceae bacterium]|nr:hypothetical protein [Desulfobacteraceae bacterium]